MPETSSDRAHSAHSSRPRYANTCTFCLFLGTHGIYDLYYCTEDEYYGGVPGKIHAKAGSGYESRSMRITDIEALTTHTALVTGLRLAIEAGFWTPPNDTGDAMERLHELRRRT